MHNACMGARDFLPITVERVEAIASALRADCKLTVQAASLDAGVSPAAIKKAQQRLRDGTGGDIVAPIQRAVDAQCAELLRRAEAAAAEGNRGVSFYQWWLESKSPLEYGKSQKIELSGNVGGGDGIESMSDEQLLAIIEGRK